MSVNAHLYGHQEYVLVKPWNRLFLWATDVRKAVADLNLKPAGSISGGLNRRGFCSVNLRKTPPRHALSQVVSNRMPDLNQPASTKAGAVQIEFARPFRLGGNPRT